MVTHRLKINGTSLVEREVAGCFQKVCNILWSLPLGSVTLITAMHTCTYMHMYMYVHVHVIICVVSTAYMYMYMYTLTGVSDLTFTYSMYMYCISLKLHNW